MTDTDPLLYADEVAGMCGWADPRRPNWMAAQTRRKIAQRGTLDAGDFPLPVDRVPRVVPARKGARGGATRTVNSPRWRRSAVVRFLANRKGPGGRIVQGGAA